MKKDLLTKILVVFFVLFGFSWGASAQEEAFNKGDRVVQLGVGLGNYFDRPGYKTKVPPVSGSFEVGILDLLDGKGAIGVGGYLAYTSFGTKGIDKFTVSDLIIGPRGTFHYQFVEKLDTYAGLMLGYDIVSYSHTDSNLSGSEFISSFYVGARYYLADKIAVFGEFGYGIAPMEFGISYKF